MRHCFLHEFEIKVVFILKVSCFLFVRSWHLTLKGFPLFAHWLGSQKYKTLSFAQWFGGFSYAIQEKFTAWRVNSTLNFTRKTDIARIDIVRICRNLEKSHCYRTSINENFKLKWKLSKGVLWHNQYSLDSYFLKSHFLRISRIERHSQKIEFFFILPKHPFG